jgi:hypothetical protein
MREPIFGGAPGLEAGGELLTTGCGLPLELLERLLVVDRLAHVLGDDRRRVGLEVHQHLGTEHLDQRDLAPFQTWPGGSTSARAGAKCSGRIPMATSPPS